MGHRSVLTGFAAMLAVSACLTVSGCLPVRSAAASGGTVSPCTGVAIASGRVKGVATTTTLTASPDPAAAGAPVTLSAAVSAAGHITPTGLVRFEAGGADIGSPVTLIGGLASTKTTFAAAGPVPLSAVFTPVCAFARSSTGTYTETIGPAVTAPFGNVPITIAVPQSGAFIVTVAPGTVNLAVSGLTAAGTLQDVTVTDTRNFYPGWSVSGQESGFTGAGTAAGSVIPGDRLGWTPTAVGALHGGATLGGTVTPVSPGLGTTAATLASAAAGCGFGTNVLSASVTLAIPPTAAPGPYSGALTITYIEAGPQNQTCVPVKLIF